MSGMMKQYVEEINDYLIQMSAWTNHELLGRMLEEAILTGGKRVRPILCLITARMYHEAYQQALPQACALELFHTFSLVHDDIMDEAPTRRGQPSVYFRHGRDHAILAGDVILILAYSKLVEGLDLDKSRRVVACFTDTAVKVCEGQMFDMDFEAKHFPTQEAYMKMIELKTSVLIGAAMKLGAIVGGASDSEAEKLYEYGVLNGLAFQIQDDLLDAFGDPSLVGKRLGGDILQGKKTLLTIICAEKSGDQRQVFEELFFDVSIPDDDKIEQVLAWYKRLNVMDDVKQMRNDLTSKADYLLDQLKILDSKKLELKQLSSWLLNRNH